MPAPYVIFVDEIEAVHELLRDPERNFRLNEVIPVLTQNTPGGSISEHDRTVRHRPADTVEQWPSIEIGILGVNALDFGEVMEEGFLQDSYRLGVEITIEMPRGHRIVYDGKEYVDSITALRLILHIIKTIFGHNHPYCTDDGLLWWSDIQMDSATIQSAPEPQSIDTLITSFSFMMHSKRPYYKGAPIPG